MALKKKAFICFLIVSVVSFCMHYWYDLRKENFIQTLTDERAILDPFSAYLSQWFPTHKVDVSVNHVGIIDVLALEPSKTVTFTCKVEYFSGLRNNWIILTETETDLASACAKIKIKLDSQIPKLP